MAGYRQSAPDRAKAGAATLLVHAAIGAVFLSGLATNIAQRPDEALQMFDVTLPPPPPIVEVPIEESAPKGDPGEAGKKAEPTPIVAPEPKIVVPANPPVAAAPVPGQGAAPSAGAALAGTGTGAGGIGNGLGGGGSGGSGAGFTPARIIRKIPDSQYRRISAGRIPSGTAAITFLVNTNGLASNCRIVRTSGDTTVDAILCDVATRYMRFRPALDPAGRPVAQDLTYSPRWWPD